jgi:hypothetical protein
VDGTKVTFSPREHVLVLLLAQRRVDGQAPYDSHKSPPDDYNNLARLLKAEAKNNFSDWRTELPTDMDVETIRKVISSIRGKLKKAGDPGRRLEKILESKAGVGLHLDASAIELC